MPTQRRDRLRSALRALAAGVCAAGVCLTAAGAAVEAAEKPDALLFRVFLKDGTPLVSYGEYARIGDRVVFTVPLGSAALPDGFQIVSLPSDRIDWDKTTRYTDTVRYQRYVASRGDADYTALTAEVARALSEIALTPDPARKLEVARRTRAMLFEWPRTHFGYRSREVRDLTLTLDEAISEVRAGLGENRFDIELVAVLEPPPGDVLAEPTLEQSMVSAMAAARAADVPAERQSLQHAILAVLGARAPELSPRWASALRDAVRGDQRRDQRVARAYVSLTSRSLQTATRRSAEGDVAGVERVLADVRARDARLGARRPDEVAALVATLESTLETARARRLELDRFDYRNRTDKAYRVAVKAVTRRLEKLSSDVAAIRAMSGPAPSRLAPMLSRLAGVRQTLAPLTPPDELRDAHSSLVSAVSLMEEAARRRQDAVMAADRQAAGNASAAAAGSLLLLDRARAGVAAYFGRTGSL